MFYNIAQRFFIILASAVLGLGAINANPSQSATIAYAYLSEREVPFIHKVSGSFSFDDALGEPNERELTDFTLKWEVPEGVFNFKFSDFTSVPKFDQSRATLVGSWEVPDLANLLEVPNGWEVGKGTFAWGVLPYFTNKKNISLYSDSYTELRGNCGSPGRFKDGLIRGNPLGICTAMAFLPVEVRYKHKHIESEIIKKSVPEPSSALGLLAIGVIGAVSVFRRISKF